MDERADRDRRTVDATLALLLAGPAALLLVFGPAYLLDANEPAVPWLLGAWFGLTVALAAVLLRRRR